MINKNQISIPRYSKFLLLFLILINEYNIFAQPLATGLISPEGSISLPVDIDRRGLLKLELNFKPSLGYFIYHNLELTFGSDIGAELFSINYNDRSNQVIWGFSLAGKYYFPIADRWHFYLGAGGRFNIKNIIKESILYDIFIGPGFLLHISESLALNFGFPITVTLADGGVFHHLQFNSAYFGIKGLL